jgi:hypothetical protein
MVYALWLWSFALCFVIAERLWPSVRRPLRRRGWLTDLGYLVFNSEYLGVILGIATARWFASFELPLPATAVLAPLPMLAQLGVILIAFDFARW